jgi:Putative DnaT-like ssDNA binding protein
MALTLIKEDGTGKADANAYADLDDANAYHDGHLYASAWTAATDAQKTTALVMATRLIDAEYQFNGTRTTADQALQWPRAMCPEPDNVHVPISVLLPIPYDYVEYDIVPKAVVQATCEMARELLIADRTTAPPGEGLSYQNVGGNQTGYDKADKRPVLSQLAQVMLAKYGSQISAKSGAVRLMRV